MCEDEINVFLKYNCKDKELYSRLGQACLFPLYKYKCNNLVKGFAYLEIYK